jgi:hypothetical protein
LIPIKLDRFVNFVELWREIGDWNDFCHPVGDVDFECIPRPCRSNRAVANIRRTI